MTHKNINILKTFDESHIPDLDVAVLGALELFQSARLPTLDIPYTRPMVVGSGNAEATGRIMFKDRDAVFASESTYKKILMNITSIDGVVLVSASGGKHAPMIAQYAKEKGKPVTLITNNEETPAKKSADDVYVFPKNREPYTYNTSTYLGMIMSVTKEDPASIYTFLQRNVDPISFPDFSQHHKYYLVVPPEFAGSIRLLQIKFIELFGRKIARDVETSEYIKHATTVVPSGELFISFGEENTMWGEPKNRLHVPLPEDADYGAMMAVAYYIIGQIQKAHPPYFKEHVAEYTQRASQVFGQEIKPIVE